MKAGDIIFVRGDSFLSDMVRVVDKGPFSHVAIAISENEILEAQWFTRSRITEFYFEDYEIIDLGFTDEERKQIVDISPTLIGKWYDFLQILGYLIKHPFNNPNNLICSEMIAVILNELGRVDYEEMARLKPNELYNYLDGRDF